MASKRLKGGAWEYTLRAKVLPRPVYLRFRSEADGDEYVGKLQRLLDAGIVPPEFATRADAPRTVGQAIDAYLLGAPVKDCDERELLTIDRAIGSVALSQVDFAWCERWVRGMKQTAQLAPGTIKHRTGALARLFDWLMRRGDVVANPLRLLPRGFATYTAGDAAVLGALGQPVRVDVARWRRLGADEEAAIRRIFSFEKPEGKERALSLHENESLLLLFDLALETAMRLRECYTLDLDQIDLPGRTIYLDRTKNGDSRQVPLSSVSLARLQGRLHAGLQAGRLFPWWSGDPSERELRRVTALLSRQFARIFAAARVADFHFHDLRHEATCRLFERTTLSDLRISLITGHRDPRMLRRYANLRASDMADALW